MVLTPFYVGTTIALKELSDDGNSAVLAGMFYPTLE